MKTIWSTFLLIAGVAVAGSAGGEVPNHVAAAANAGVAPSQGHKWATDPALRTGMSAIRGALASRLPAIRAGTLPRSEFQALGATIGARVKTILAECTLAPEADAQLHPILAALLVAANAMQGSEATASAPAAREAAAAVNRYGQIFDDPGWRPLDSD